MIVDDNIIDQMITLKILKNSPVQSEVLIMDGSVQALNYLESNKADSNSLPTLIILDLDMPVVNGFGFLEEFSKYSDELRSAIKIVVLTATETKEDIELLSANPAVTKIIFKPLNHDSLAGIL